MNQINRREVIVGSLAGAFSIPVLATATEPEPENNGKYLVTIHLNVGQLPPHRAEAFSERVLFNLKEKKPNDCLNIIVLPQRGYETWVEVTPLNEQEEPSEAIENFVYEIAEMKRPHMRREHEKDQKSLKDYVMLMSGAPVIKIPQALSDEMDRHIDLAFKYGIENKFDYVMEAIPGIAHIDEYSDAVFGKQGEWVLFKKA